MVYFSPDRQVNIYTHSLPLFKHTMSGEWIPPPPPPPAITTTAIPHIERERERDVGFKWMWTQLVAPNKMAPGVVDLCAGFVVLLPQSQIRRFRHGFFSSAVLDCSSRNCLRVRRLQRQQTADNWRYLCRSSLPTARSEITAPLTEIIEHSPSPCD